MGKKPVLMIVTFTQKVREYLCESISDVIGHLVDVRGYSQEEKMFYDEDPDLVVTSGDYTNDLAEATFPGVPVINGTRVLTGVNIEQVLAIPPNTRVLVVSTPQAPALEDVDLLQQAGINHVVYDCYWRGKNMDLSQYEYAITPNMLHVCPYPFKHIINLGQKALSVRSFVQILIRLGIDLRYADIFENRYFRLHIETCRKVVNALNYSKQLSQNQALILDEMDELVISTDAMGQIIFANQCARAFFSLKTDLNSNAGLHNAILTMDRARAKKCSDPKGAVQRTPDLLVEIDDQQLFGRKSMICSNGQRQLLYTFRKAEHIQALEHSLRRKLYHHGFSARYTFDDIWGDSPQSVRARNKARVFAATDQTVLIIGESGTGKEMLAQAIHNASPRAKEPFVGINLASMSRSLVESELFGYEEGAFTGARKSGKPGMFEIANNGTIFLDEIGDAPLGVQIMLLRVLEERIITRVGGSHYIPINVRIIAATNRPLQDMIKSGEFRSDLYYRLNVLSIQTAPLRSMRGEIPDFLRQFGRSLFEDEKAFSPEAVQVLREYAWPGNFRELKNVSEYLHFTTQGQGSITVKDLPEYLPREGGVSCEPASEEEEPLEEVSLREPLLLDTLRLLQQAGPHGVGRGFLVSTLSSRGTPVSESAVKRCLAVLKRGGLVRSGSTRQGSFITERGKRLLLRQDGTI